MRRPLPVQNGFWTAAFFSPAFEGNGQLPSVDREVNLCGFVRWETAAICGPECGPLLDQELVMSSLWTSGLQNSDK